jgi:hypothetical protein
MATNGATPVAAVQLPIFDISDPTPEVGRSMIAAAAKYGFLFLDTKGTDFAEAIVDRVFETVRRRMTGVITISADPIASVEGFLFLAGSRESRMRHWA